MPNSPCAAFSFVIGSINDQQYIAIIDSNIGNMSVVKDIRNVLYKVASVVQTKIHDLADVLILCKDEDDIWDGYDPIQEKFIELAKMDFMEAFEKYYEIRWYEIKMLLKECRVS